MLLKELYSLIDIASDKTVDFLPGTQTFTTFPRHPLVSPSASNFPSPRNHQFTLSESNVQEQQLQQQAVTDLGPHVASDTPCIPQQASFNIVGYDETAVFTATSAATVPLNVGPPPKSGFVRKWKLCWLIDELLSIVIVFNHQTSNLTLYTVYWVNLESFWVICKHVMIVRETLIASFWVICKHATRDLHYRC